MAVGAFMIGASEVAYSPRTRLDVRYHSSASLISPYFDGLRRTGQPLAELISSAGNGPNIPASSYADDLDDAGALYVSVGALSQFALRAESATPLLTSENQVSGTRYRLPDVRTTDDEVLLTRSGTPGIAWPGSLAPEALPIIPSGFVIRLRVEDFDTVALSAVLNHPVWRLRSLALSAGKRQDNISQANLADIPIPILDRDTQRVIADLYRATLAEIEAISGEERLSGVCDGIVAEAASLPLLDTGSGEITTRTVRLSEVAHSPTTRADNRWHGVANQQVLTALEEVPTVPLGAVLSALPSKGRQPTYLEEPDGDEAFAILTSTMQMGQVVLENAKPISLASLRSAAAVRSGQLLVAMDGDGSLGKAAVVPATSLHLMRDSHVAVVNTDGDEYLAHALACWLNSTWGQTQTNGMMTGSTGQTGLRPTDLTAVRVPQAVIDQAEAIAARYSAALTYIDTPARRTRRILCDGSARVSEVLLTRGSIELAPKVAANFVSPEHIWKLLEVAYPSVR